LSWAELSAELRFPLWGPLGGVLFANAGQVRSRPHDLKLDAFFTSVGAGLRFATPIGPLRLDVGVPLEKGPGIPDYRLHFSVGHAF
jgi:outer membrane translocation and assembly module TamA